jgi:hypothetical protein
VQCNAIDIVSVYSDEEQVLRKEGKAWIDRGAEGS